MKAKAALLAFLLLLVAVCGSGGALDAKDPLPGAINLALALAALALALVALATAAGGVDEPLTRRALAGLAAAMLLWLACKPALGPYWPAGQVAWPIVAAALAIGLLTAQAITCRTAIGMPLVLLIYGGLSAWLILAVATDLNVDMRVVQEFACRHLMAGTNPYSQTYPDPRDLDNPISFPYPPLNILMVLPGYWLGDIRWSLIASLLATMWLLVESGRALGLPNGHPAELPAIALLANPWGVTVVMLGWTDPQLSLFAALAGWAHVSGRRTLLLVALAGLVSVKQYGILFLPAYWLLGRLGWRDGLKIALLAMAPIVPFVLCGPADFWQGVVGMHLGRPFRPDSLSVLALVHALTGTQLPAILGFLAAGAAMIFAWWKGVATLADAALANAAIFLAFILFNQDAHLNYFWLAMVFLAQGLIGTLASGPASPAEPAPASCGCTSPG